MSGASEWTVEFYLDGRGHSPVLDFIEGLPGKERARVARYIELLEDVGTVLGMPYARQIERGLWELRPQPNWLFYFAHTGRRFFILHGFRKKSRQAPRREIETARRRMEEIREREA